jgi:hypothetical protein
MLAQVAALYDLSILCDACACTPSGSDFSYVTSTPFTQLTPGDPHCKTKYTCLCRLKKLPLPFHPNLHCPLKKLADFNRFCYMVFNFTNNYSKDNYSLDNYSTLHLFYHSFDKLCSNYRAGTENLHSFVSAKFVSASNCKHPTNFKQ